MPLYVIQISRWWSLFFTSTAAAGGIKPWYLMMNSSRLAMVYSEKAFYISTSHATSLQKCLGVHPLQQLQLDFPQDELQGAFLAKPSCRGSGTRKDWEQFQAGNKCHSRYGMSRFTGSCLCGTAQWLITSWYIRLSYQYLMSDLLPPFNMFPVPQGPYFQFLNMSIKASVHTRFILSVCTLYHNLQWDI